MINIYSGAPPFNVSLAYMSGGLTDIPDTFIADTFSLLQDPSSVATFPPSTPNCTSWSSECFSYVIPGDLQMVQIVGDNNNASSPWFAPPSGATTFVSLNASAYQLEYFPSQPGISFSPSDCQGVVWVAVNLTMSFMVCVKNIGNDLVAGRSHQFQSFPG
jgi:hypothetical protein